MHKTKPKTMSIIQPINGHVLIRKDTDRSITRGGILLPDGNKIVPTTGRIVAIDEAIQDSRVKLYDRVVIDPQFAFPADDEGDRTLFLVPFPCIRAIIRTENKTSGEPNAKATGQK